VLAVATIAVGSGPCESGTTGASSLPTLSVVTVNMANGVDLSGVAWRTRIDRLAAAIESAELVPDIISMTESAGWWSCAGVDDYDMVDRLLWVLKERLDARYRVAYMVGTSGSVRNGIGISTCSYYTGDTLIYNSDRIVNLTPGDVAGKGQIGYDDPFTGVRVRRSLPLCTRGTNLMSLEQLIDGPPQSDKCSVETPSGPAWVQLEQTRHGDVALVASLGRFGLNAAPGSSFDVVTTHPTAREEEDQAESIDHFIAGLTAAPYRTSAPYYPVVVVGDFNGLAAEERGWPTHTKQVFHPTDVMVVALGDGVGISPLHELNVAFSSTLPGKEPCSLPAAGTNDPATAAAAPEAFSDHCGLVVRFSGG
jgi:endonuclease/exonuclease/phosphatase family metal-dependent hydrolase